MREYVLLSPNNGIHLFAYLSYDSVTQTWFIFLERPIDWTPILEDRVNDVSDEEENPSEDMSDIRESLGIEEYPYEDSS